MFYTRKNTAITRVLAFRKRLNLLIQEKDIPFSTYRHENGPDMELYTMQEIKEYQEYESKETSGLVDKLSWLTDYGKADLHDQMQTDMVRFEREIHRQNAKILSKDIDNITRLDIMTFSENEFMLKSNYLIQEEGEAKSVVVTDNMRDGKIITSAGKYNPLDLIGKIKENSVNEILHKETPFVVYVSTNDFFTYGTDGRWIELPLNERELKETMDYIILRSFGFEDGFDKSKPLNIVEMVERPDCSYVKDSVEISSNVYDLNVVASLIGNEEHPAVQAYIEANGSLTLPELANLLVQEKEISLNYTQKVNLEKYTMQEIKGHLAEQNKMPQQKQVAKKNRHRKPDISPSM